MGHKPSGVTDHNGRNLQGGNVRLNERQRKSHRDSIKTGQLLTLLHNHAFGLLKLPVGKKDGSTVKGDPYLLEPSQVKAIQILLDKALPTLQAIDATVRTEIPTLTPQELQIQLGQLLRAMPEDEIMRLRQGLPSLKVIEGEVVGNGNIG